jgi:hypothetical protein
MTNAAPKLTDVERDARFVPMGKEVGASDRPVNFDKAFAKVIEAPLGDCR